MAREVYARDPDWVVPGLWEAEVLNGLMNEVRASHTDGEGAIRAAANAAASSRASRKESPSSSKAAAAVAFIIPPHPPAATSANPSRSGSNGEEVGEAGAAALLSSSRATCACSAAAGAGAIPAPRPKAAVAAACAARRAGPPGGRAWRTRAAATPSPPRAPDGGDSRALARAGSVAKAVRRVAVQDCGMGRGDD